MSHVFEHLGSVLRERGIPPHGVLHVGAHAGEEVEVYRAIGFGRIILAEPNPAMLTVLQAIPGVEVVPAAIGIRNHPCVAFFNPGRTQLVSSLMMAGCEVAPGFTAPMRRLDALDCAGCNVLVVDVQGAELDVLMSGSLDQFDVVVCEVDYAARYIGAPSPDEICDHLLSRSFRQKHYYPHADGRAGDFLFLP
jgi:FkbM family methyltransferase